MPYLSLSLIESSVTAIVRKRGEAYARSGQVTLRKRQGEGPVRAVVHGNDSYDVRVGADGRGLWADCTCPYFEGEEELCKHIWATLLVCAARRIEFAGRVDDLRPNFPDAGQPFHGDDDYDEEDDEELDDEDDQDYSEALRLIDFRSYGGLPPGNVVPIRPKPAARMPVPSPWRWQVNSVASQTDWAAPEAPPAEISWVIDPLLSGVSLTIEIATRTLKKNGELGKPASIRLPHAAVPLMAPAEREIFSALGATAYSSWGSFDRSVNVGWPASEYVVPKIVATGRLFIRVAKGEYELCTAFDAGEPWHLAVHAEELGAKYTLIPDLRRGEERRPLRDAVVVTHGGLVVFRNAIARFADDRGLYRWAQLMLKENVEVPAAELTQFVKAVAASRTPLRIEWPGEVAWQERRVPHRATLELTERGDGLFTGSAKFHYEEQTVGAFENVPAIPDEKSRTVYLRDAEGERRKVERMWALGFRRYGEVVTVPQSQLATALPKLLESGWEVHGAEGAYAAPGDLELTVSTSIDWFDLNGLVDFGTEKVRLPRLLSALRKGESVVKLSDGRLGLIRQEWREQLEPFLAGASEEQKEGVRFRRNQVLLLDALLRARPEVSFDDVFDEARRRILDVKVVPEQPPDSFQGELRPYQSEGLGWFSFLRGLGFGGCLADDMGLGKTIQVLALLDARRRSHGDNGGERRPSLVVVPRSLVFNWKSEAARFTPELRFLDHSTPDRVRDTGHFGQYDVVLTTYALLRKEAELFSGVEFDYAILDEAQAIKNAGSQAAKTALLVRARHRLALSGTPVENHLGELASLFEFLNPGMLRAGSSRMTKMLRDAGSKTAEAANARTMLSHAVRPFILRRTKAQVARDLPERVEQTVWCELEAKQRKLYDELRDFYRASLLGRVASQGMNRSKIHILEALLRMRQAACHPGLVDVKRAQETSAKLDVLFEELPILLEGRQKILIFSQFTSLLSIVRREMRQRGLTYAYIDGSSRDREAQVRRFQEDPEVPLFLISLKAGGLGLNLTAAEYVFLLDPWWNPAVEAQAIDRAHRIGQTRNVFAYRLVARDTIEEKILQLQQNKRALADAILSEENSILRQLTAEDLDLLLS